MAHFAVGVVAQIWIGVNSPRTKPGWVTRNAPSASDSSRTATFAYPLDLGLGETAGEEHQAKSVKRASVARLPTFSEIETSSLPRDARIRR